MTTIAVTVSGSTIAALSGSPSTSYTINDTDLQTLLSWFAGEFPELLPASPTDPQILGGWVQWWMNNTIASIQNYQQQHPTIPPPISLTVATGVTL